MPPFSRIALAAPLLTALSPSGCGDDPADQAAAPLDLPATPDKLEKLAAVVERFPEVAPLAEQARADGTVTEQEIIEVLSEAERAKAGRDAN